MIKSICIFCGSSLGSAPIYASESYKFTKEVVKKGHTIIYGGGNIGIMGVVAKAAIENNGKIIGVAPKFLKDKEVVRDDLTELILVEDMFERKKKLIEISDGFAVLPGGIGTINEFFEVLTAQQLETIIKPVGILNTDGYYNDLLNMLSHFVEKKFFRKEHLKNLIVEKDPIKLIKSIENHIPQKIEKWISELKKKQYF